MPSAAQTFETTFNTFTEVGILGEGGSGRVYKVVDAEDLSFALKLLRGENVSTQQRKRFKNEIAFCSQRISSHIVEVVDDGVAVISGKRCPFYVMPLYQGTLRRLMTDKLPHEKILPYFSQLLDGIEAAHLKGITHRDFKPENVLFDAASDRLAVADFGIARFTKEPLFTSVETRAQDKLANFQYAAPEQRVRGGDVGQSADIYALGLVLNEMFTGNVIQGTGHRPIASVAPQYSFLDDLVDRMVRFSAEERPPTVASVKQELIARGSEFVSIQRLNELKNKVIPSSEVDDPIAKNPIKPINCDYVGGALVFELDREPPPNWPQFFRSQGNYAAIMGKGPEYFSFDGRHASVPLSDNEDTIAPIVANHFKNYVAAANRDYTEALARSQQSAEARQRRELREQIQQEEKRLQVRKEVLKSIKF